MLRVLAIILTAFLAAFVFQPLVKADANDVLPKNSYSFTSGTGFFVTNYHIVTNQHVVNECKNIIVRGAVKPVRAELVDVNKDSDLALLKVRYSPTRVALLRGNNLLNIGEPVTVIGYPLEHGVTGEYLVKQARLLSITDPLKGDARIQFTDAIDKGNSGGPLLDSNGTIIGVIVGQMSYYMTKAGEGEPVDKSVKPFKKTSVAISLSELKKFLGSNNVNYRTSDNRVVYADELVENKGKQYTVNIHCVK